jgi:predicted nucleic acid-binding protein
LKAADTSTVVAAFASWHALHDAARRELDRGLDLIEHCALETYSVLTRLPPPHRVRADIVRDFLDSRFQQPFLRVPPEAYRQFVLELPTRGVVGGAAYDALVAVTAATNRIELVTCDRRASAVYERYGVRTLFLS